MATPASTVTIVIGARANTETGFARVRRAVRNLNDGIRENFGTTGRSSGLSFLQRFGNVLQQGLSSAAQSGSGIAQGLGEQLRGAGSSPYVAAGIAALVAAIAPVLGTLLGGALILGLGGALVGVGFAFAAKAKEVQTEFTKTGKVINKVLTDASKPLVPVLTYALKTAQKLVKEFGPILREAFDVVAPHLQTFIDNLADALRKLKPAIVPIVEAFGTILDALGPELVTFFEELSDALQDLAEEFKKQETAENFAMVVGLLLRIIPPAIKVLGLLAQAFNWQVRNAKSAVAAIKDLINWIRSIPNKTVRLAQRGANAVVGAARRVREFLNRIVGKKNVDIAIRGVTSAIKRIGDLISKIRSLVGKTVNIGVNFFKGAGSAIGNFLGFAHGGIVGAAGGGARSNLTLVGENGPEIVDLAPGSRVRSNADSRRLMSSGGSGSGGLMHITLQIGDRRLGELLIDPIRNAVTTRGGNVQAVLGR